MKTWTHPGGKLRELGAESLTNTELLAILISTGTRGKTAEDVAKEILDKFGSFKGMATQPLEKFLLRKNHSCTCGKLFVHLVMFSHK
jgi:DNA repair protein RadC